MDDPELLAVVSASLTNVCERDDARTLRTLLRELLGKPLHELVKAKSSNGEFYDVESPQLRDIISKSLILTCSSRGATDCLKLLIQKLPHVVDLNARDDNGTPCLHLATVGNYVDTVALLLLSGSDIDGRDRHMRSPLHCAVASQQMDVLSLLLAKRANMAAQDVAGATPLHYAVKACHDADVSDGEETDGRAAEDGGYASMATEVLRTVLAHAKGVLSTQDAAGKTALHYAASAGNVEACRLLCARGAKADITDSNGNTALHLAARSGCHEAIDMFVRKCHLDVNLRNLAGLSPLCLAVTGRQPACVDILLQFGASEVTDKHGLSIVHMAAAAGDVLVMELLRAAGYDLWRHASRGEQPIHIAAITKSDDVVRYLLRDTKNANPRGLAMKSCLHMVASTGNCQLISDLVEADVDINSVLKYRDLYQTALDFAEKKHQTEAAACIRGYGGLNAEHVINRSARVLQRSVRRAVAVRQEMRGQEEVKQGHTVTANLGSSDATSHFSSSEVEVKERIETPACTPVAAECTSEQLTSEGETEEIAQTAEVGNWNAMASDLAALQRLASPSPNEILDAPSEHPPPTVPPESPDRSDLVALQRLASPSPTNEILDAPSRDPPPTVPPESQVRIESSRRQTGESGFEEADGERTGGDCDSAAAEIIELIRRANEPDLVLRLVCESLARRAIGDDSDTCDQRDMDGGGKLSRQYDLEDPGESVTSTAAAATAEKRRGKRRKQKRRRRRSRRPKTPERPTSTAERTPPPPHAASAASSEAAERSGALARLPPLSVATIYGSPYGVVLVPPSTDKMSMPKLERNMSLSGLTASQKIRLDIQLSVERHGALRTFASRYRQAHASQAVAVMRLPVISPSKYMSAVRTTLLHRRYASENRDADHRLPDIRH